MGTPSWAEHPHLFVPEDFPRLQKVVEECSINGTPYEIELRIIQSDGEIRTCIARGQAVKDSNGKIIRQFGITQDITERKQAEAKTRDSEEQLRAFLENSAVIGWLKDEEGKYIFLSKNYERRLHVREKDFIGNTDYDVWPNDIAKTFRQNDQSVLASNQPIEIVEYTTDSKGKKIWWLNHKFIFTNSAGRRYIGGLGIDITERILAEEALQDALSEKEVLLREIHHRVKNNMQIIIALLRMQARRIDDKDLTRIFDDCRDRVEAMSLIHEALYQSDDLAHIDFGRYLDKLSRNLSQAYDISRKGIALTVDYCDVAMSIDQGIAVGMVIVELVTNALKHAFQEESEGGTIRITMTYDGPDSVKLIIADNGSGLPFDLDFQNLSSLGLRLVNGIVRRELSGSMDVERLDKGTRFVIRFKRESKN